MVGLLTDRVALDEYIGVWFSYEVSEAIEVRSMGISFRIELQEKITSRRHMIEHLEKVGATSGWLMRLNRDQKDDVSLLGLLDTFKGSTSGIKAGREALNKNTFSTHKICLSKKRWPTAQVLQMLILREQLGDASIEIQAYTQALKKVEAQLVAH
ncbi:hypothetical protein Tco_1051025 [Tanacetum coccineum]